MKRPSLSARTLGRVALRGMLAAVAASVLFIVGLLSPGATEGAGPPFSVDGGVTRLHVWYTGGCQPGYLGDTVSNPEIGAGEKINATQQKLIKLSNYGDVFGCVGKADATFKLRIGSELFDAANVNTETMGDSPNAETLLDEPTGVGVGDTSITVDSTAGAATSGVLEIDDERMSYTIANPTTFAVTRGQGGTAAAPHADNATVIAPRAVPFNLDVKDCATSDFAGAGDLYVGSELMTHDLKVCDGIGGPTNYFRITGRAQTRPGPGGQATTAVPHASGTFVRAQSVLKLVARGVPTYVGGPATGYPQHDVGALVRSPKSYLTCRARMQQLTVSGSPDDVVSRSRCYGILEPGYETGPSAPYWPDDPPAGSNPIDPNMPLAGLIRVFYHDISTGTIDDAGNGQMVLTTGVEGFDCFPLFPSQLWVKITEQVKLNKTATNTGTSNVSLYTNDTCTDPPALALGSADNVTSTEIDPNTDTDGDGCSDFEELGADEKKGGLRDPFNPWDFYDVNGDRVVDLFNDIVQVISKFGLGEGDGGYAATHDRDGLLGPSPWNKDGPDGVIDLFNDIVGVIQQFGHDCT